MVEVLNRSDANPTPLVQEGKNSIVISRLRHFNNEIKGHSLSLKYALSGSASYHLPDRSFPLAKGGILIIPPQQKVEGLVKDPNTREGICLYFSKAMVNEAWQSILAPEDLEGGRLSGPGPEEFITLHFRDEEHQLHAALSQLARQEGEGANHTEAMMQICAFICRLQVKARKQFTSLRAVKPSTQKEIIQRLYRVQQYIRNYYDTDIDLQTLSEEALLSKFHLLRYFHQAFGITPHQYLIQYRLEKSKELLQASGLSVKSIAQKVGFANTPSYSKAFKKKYGFSPAKEFRNFE